MRSQSIILRERKARKRAVKSIKGWAASKDNDQRGSRSNGDRKGVEEVRAMIDKR